MANMGNMKSIDKAASIATRYALDDTHGYAQDNRWGVDYDCSSLMATVLKEAGFDTTFTWTGNMEQDLLSHGFKKIVVNTALYNDLKRGDILLYHNPASGNGHTAMYLGDGKIVHATSNEFGGTKNGKSGDQTGNEICVANYFNFPWSAVFRYEGDSVDDEYYTVKPHDTLWAISQMFNTTVDKICELNGIADKNLIYPGQVLRVKDGDKQKPIELETNIITITIDGSSIKNCTCKGNTITIEVGD